MVSDNFFNFTWVQFFRIWGNEMEIQQAEILIDLEDIVHVHITAFPRFFLTFMGHAFVKDYYRSVLEYSLGMVFVAKDKSGLAGFVAGFGKPHDFYAFYRQRRTRLIPKVLVSVMKKPSLLPLIAQNLKRVTLATGSESEVELSSICVLHSFSGRGIGKALIERFIDVSRMNGFRSVYLSTDAFGNESVNAFYLRQGFIFEDSFFHGKRKMNSFRFEL